MLVRTTTLSFAVRRGHTISDTKHPQALIRSPRVVRRTPRFSVLSMASSGPTTNAQDQAEAAAMRKGEGRGGTIAGLPPCAIEDGLQKYVLIQVGEGHLVRGAVSAAYHRDAAQPCVEQLSALGVDYEVLGGGRIALDRASKSIKIYGFSYGFPWQGRPRHDITADVVQAHFPGWTVTTSDEGY